MLGMKSLLVALATIGLGLGLLHSGVTGWRLVKEADIDALRAQASAVQQQQPQQAFPGARSPGTGAWMWDPNYRTALEKTTIIGRPEGARNRDNGSVSNPGH